MFANQNDDKKSCIKVKKSLEGKSAHQKGMSVRLYKEIEWNIIKKN